MTEEAEKEPTASELKLVLDGNSVDWFLQKLVDTANSTGLEMGITLIVGGSVVSGRLVGGKKYFETFAKEFSEAWSQDSEPQEEIYKAFAQHGEIYSQSDSDAPENPPPQFVHLLDARCFYPGSQLPSNRGVPWRGKINAVSGFSLGQLKAEKNETTE